MDRTAPCSVCRTTALRASTSAPSALQPAVDLLHRLRRQQPLLVERALGHGEQRRVLQSARSEHAGEVAAHLGDRVGRSAVQDDRDRSAAVGGLLQETPGHLVGVAGRRGDEQPQVRGGEQLRGQAAVALLDGVDVGSVQQRQALRDRRRGDQLDRARVGCGASGALELGKDALLVEPRRVVGMVDEHGRTRRRPEYAGLADLLADQRVHQRRLAGARRPTDDRRAAERRSARAWAARSPRAGRSSPPARAGSPPRRGSPAAVGPA